MQPYAATWNVLMMQRCGSWKKIMVLLIGLALAGACYARPAEAAYTPGPINDNFDSFAESADASLADYTVTAGAGTSSWISGAHSASGSKSLKLDDPVNGQTVRVMKKYSSSSTYKAIAEANLYLENSASSLEMLIYTNTSYRVRVYVSGGQLKYLNGADGVTYPVSGVTIQPQRWYNLRLEADAATGVRTFRIYLDGKLVSDNTPFSHTTVSTLDTIGFQTGSSSTSSTYLDDVRARTVSQTTPALSPDTTANVTNTGLDLAFADSATWRGAVTGVLVNGQPVASGMYTLSAGNLHLDGSLFPTAGSYEILAAADGYFHARAVQTILNPPAAPALQPDSTHAVVGQAIELAFTDDAAWRAAIASVKVDGQTLAGTDYTISPGVVHIEPSAFTLSKSYAISIHAVGYMDAAIVQTVLLAPPILLTDSDNNQPGEPIDLAFTDDAAWRSAFTGVSVNGQAVPPALYILDNGNLRLSEDLFLSARTYHIVASAAAYADIAVDQAVVSTHDEPPALVADQSNPVIGEPIELSFSDDPDWRSAIGAVKVNGTVVSPGHYSLTTGRLLFDSTVFPQPGSYQVLVYASGFDPTWVRQSIYSLPAVTSVQAAAASSNKTILTWEKTDGALYYNIYRGSSTTFTPDASTLVKRTSATRYQDFMLQPATDYYYKVAAVNAPHQEGDIVGSVHAATMAASASLHPSVMFFASEIEDLRAKKTSGPWKDWYARQRTFADSLLDKPVSSIPVKDRGSRVLALSLMYALEEYGNGKGTYYAKLIEYLNDLPNCTPAAYGSDLYISYGAQAYAVAYDMMYGELTPAERTTYATNLRTHTLQLYNVIDSKINNFIEVMAGGLATTGAAIGDTAFMEKAKTNMERALALHIKGDGAYNEGEGYNSYAMRYLSDGMSALRNVGYADLFHHANYQKALGYWAEKTTPIGLFPLFGDARFRTGAYQDGAYWLAANVIEHDDPVVQQQLMWIYGKLMEHSQDANYEINDSYDSLSTGSLPPGYQVTATASIYAVDVSGIRSASPDNSVRILDQDTEGNVRVVKSFSSVQEDRIDIRVFVPINNALSLSLLNGNTVASAVYLREDGQLHMDIGGGSSLAAFNPGSWNQLRFDVDAPAGKIDVYLNGQKVADQVPLISGPQPWINELALETSVAGTTEGIYFDDLRMSSRPPSTQLWAPYFRYYAEIPALAPDRSSAVDEGGGLAYFRSGVEDEDLYISLNSRPYIGGSSHDRPDQGSIDMWAYGSYVIHSPGYAGSGVDPYHSYSRDGKAFNGVKINGVTQNVNTPAEGIAAYLTDPGLDYAEASVVAPFAPYGALHRTLLFIKPDAHHPGYAILSDDVTAASSSYPIDWYLHGFSRDLTLSGQDARWKTASWIDGEPVQLQAHIAAPSVLLSAEEARDASGNPFEEFSQGTPDNREARYLRATPLTTGSNRFLTVLYPWKASQGAPSFTDDAANGAVVVNNSDIVFSQGASATRTVYGVTSDARLVFVRNEGDRIDSYFAKNGKQLMTLNDTVGFHSNRNVDLVLHKLEGSVLTYEAGTHLTIYHPTINASFQAKVDGAAVDSTAVSGSIDFTIPGTGRHKIELVPLPAPDLAADITDNVVGEPVDIAFVNDPAWNAAITDVLVDGRKLHADEYEVATDHLHLEATVFPDVKTYEILIFASGYADVSAQQPMLGIGPAPELTADSSSPVYGQPIELTFSDEPVWRSRITSIEVDGRTVDGAKYSVTTGKITLSYTLFPEVKTYSIVVSAYGYQGTQVRQMIRASFTTPLLTSDSSENYPGEPIQLTFQSNPAWQEAIYAVTMNGQPVLTGDYTIASGMLTIAGHSFATTGVYQIAIKSAGYVDSTISQLIIAAPAAPEAANLRIAGFLRTGQTVTGTYTYKDINGDSEGATEFRWLAGESPLGPFHAIPGAVSQAFAIPASLGGQYLQFEVTPVSLAELSRGQAAAIGAATAVLHLDDIPVASVIHDDFEGDAANAAPGGYLVTTPTDGSGSTARVSDTVASSGAHSLKLSDLSGTQSVSVRKSVPRATYVVAEASVYAPGSNSIVLEMHLQGGTQYGTRLYFRNNAIMSYDGSVLTTIAPKYTPNVWNKLKVAVNTVTQKQDVYFNDILIASQIPMTNYNVAYIDSIFITTGSSASATVSVDEVNVWIPAAPALAADAADNTIGQPMEITFTDNADWRAAITSIRLDGLTVTGDVYTMPGKLQFPGTRFPEARAYQIEIDAAGYAVGSVTQTVYGAPDLTPPVTTASLSPSQPDSPNGGYASPVTLTLQAADADSGVLLTEYSLDQGATWKPYSGPVVFERQGTYAVLYRSVDMAGNVESSHSSNFVLVGSEVAIRLRDSTGQPLSGATVTYYDGSWRSFGITDADGVAHRFLPDRNYTFGISYEGTYAQQTQHTAASNRIDFQTTNVTVRLVDSGGNPLSGGAATYYAGSWRSFGTIGLDGTASRELLPGNYTYGMTYEGTYMQKAQNTATVPDVVFATVKVEVTLTSSQLAPLSGGTAQYYAGSWRGLGTTGANGKIVKELLPGTYTFGMQYEGTASQMTINTSTSASVPFRTVNVMVRTIDDNNDPMRGGTATYYALNWRTIGKIGASGEVSKELLPGKITFGLDIASHHLQKAQDIGVSAIVIFRP
ncbi:hemoblobin-interacting domain-containing protein [Paenibacillus cymbidii]|uniref:hemoblobin-interacting domain-containing protein n=1 Tax=Paenibacillus cymbidii TaxID=1639034 RepID=UPI0010815A2B|nr:hemoblobin-interacting domain-containing protein [Paenibacillus cymbidii]